MSSKAKWADIIERLKADLKAREAGAPDAALDDEAWEIAAGLLRFSTRILAFRFPGLQQADIDDLAQKTLVKLQSLETLRRLDAAGSIEGYIFVMLRNAANDLARRRQFEEFHFKSLHEKRTAEPSAEAGYIQQSEHESVLAAALEMLSQEEREVLRMRFWSNKSIAEIAAQTNMSYSATAVRLFRILHRLRKQLGEDPRNIT
jgi:RNA polymerase sigma factor (sigma-70 family)